jgi:enoyl-CoA hydratase/carnithine racemase
MMKAASVLERPSEGFATLTLDRPERGNALSAELVEALLAGLASAVADPSLHTLVLRGRGRHFCTGFDLSDLESETDATLLARLVRIEILLDAIWRAPLRTVAIGQGRLMGAGADLFTACDVRLLVAGASLRFPGAGFGIVLGTSRLARRAGDVNALRWVSEALSIEDQEAVASGLATGVLEPEGNDTLLPAPVPPLSVDRSTFAALRRAVREESADAELAALVRSAARPGLKARIESYRQRPPVR